MKINRSKLLERAENAARESKYLDFKREFDLKSLPSWCEVVKDITAFANSGGGVIVFGVNNDGTSAEIDCAPILALDLADITNKIQSYTGYEFADLEIIEVLREGVKHAALIISGVELPMIFIRPGSYEIDGKAKSAFAKGTIYFRHGAKSEPGNRDDLLSWRDQTIEKVRKGWLGGIRKVVETPAGHAITVVSSPVSMKSGTPNVEGMAITAQLSSSPGAMKFVPQNAEELWPYRQKEVINAVNEGMDSSHVINGHDVLCINTNLDVLKAHPEFAYKPHKASSPQYSTAYADWIIAQFKQDPKFFTRMRTDYKEGSKKSK